MKNWMKLVALVAMMSMAVSGCGSSETAAETTGADETSEISETSEAEDEAEGTEDSEESAASDALFYSDGLDEDGNLTEYVAADFLELPDYTTITLSASDLEISEEELNSAIDSLLAEYAEDTQVTDRAVADGDTINLDYVGTVDGVAFDGGDTQGAGTQLVIGSGSYIDDFEEQLIGAMPGEEVTVTVTFPDPYTNNEELSGKEAEFACTINYIVESTTPELTDEFVAENLAESYKVETVDELKEYLSGNYRTNSEMSLVWEWMLENTTFTQEPEELSNLQLDNFIKVQELYASVYGLTLEDYLSYMGYDEETFRAENSETAMETAKQWLITQAIVDAENLVVEDADLESYFNGTEYSQYDEFYGTGYVRMQVKLKLVVDKIMETATVE